MKNAILNVQPHYKPTRKSPTAYMWGRAQVRAEIDQMTLALDKEVQERTESNKSLQAITEEVANAMLQRVQAKVAKRIEHVPRAERRCARRSTR